MAKIFNFYTSDHDGNGLDRCWFASSNIKYCECLDKENSLKTLKVVFNNGAQYEYYGVDVTQYLMFRNAESQGKALNEFIKSKGYEYKKLENADIDAIDNEVQFRIEGGIFVSYEDGKFTIKDNKDVVICEKEVKLTSEAFDTICDALTAVGKEIYKDGKDFENGEE